MKKLLKFLEQNWLWVAAVLVAGWYFMGRGTAAAVAGIPVIKPQPEAPLPTPETPWWEWLYNSVFPDPVYEQAPGTEHVYDDKWGPL